jgi:hypothetical protein
LFVTGVAATVTMLAGCGIAQSPRGELAENQRILASCDPSAPPASLVEIDGTGSSASESITTERMAAVESIVRRTAVCSGYLRVIVFSSSSAATSVLFDGPLRMHGATENARLKRVPSVVADVMQQIQQDYGPAVAGLPGGGSDITAQYRLAAEWIGQLGGSYQLHLTILTDGCQNISVDLCSRPLSKQEVTGLAGQVTVPQLPGASVTVAGLGRVAGTPPSSQVAEQLIMYFDAVCAQTAAAKCVSVTDYATEGR